MKPLVPLLAVALAAPMPLTALEEAIRAAEIGDVITLGNPSVIRLNPAGSGIFGDEGGTFFYSDDPESVTQNGILYADDLPAGRHRIYLYHTNDTATPRKFSVVLENLGSEAATVAFARRSLPTPSGNYFLVGKTGSELFYTNTDLPPTITIPTGERAIMDVAVEELSISTNQLLASIHDYDTDQPLRVSSVMVGTGDDTLAVFDSLTPSPTDGFARQGTFPATRLVTTTPLEYTTTSSLDGRRVIRIADTGDPFPSDPPLEGFDAQRETSTTLAGNFGIEYDLTVNVSAPDGRDVALLVNPRGGGYAGWFRTTFDGVTVETQAPANQLNVLDPNQGTLIALISPPAEPTPLRIQFIPAGASNLPFHLLFLPIERVATPSDSWVIYD